MELLVPAGNPPKAEAALRFGAHALYLGGPDLSLRQSAHGFSLPELRAVVTQAHRHGARVYYALNILAQEHHLTAITQRLEDLADTGIDALIVADPGVLTQARRLLPHIPVHVSTQANTSNSWSVHFWRDHGARRVNLARELSAARLRAVRRACPDMELEVFVHGAMCMAISGQCLLSAYLLERSGNLGACAHPCRYDYLAHGPAAVVLEERFRPGERLWELHEHDGFSQILASEDLCLLHALPWFARHGIHALKIEGRTKSLGYVTTVTDIYATALRDLAAGSFHPKRYWPELARIAGRPMATGFFAPRRSRLPLPQAPLAAAALRVEEVLGPGCFRVAVLLRLEAGTPLELVLPRLRRPRITDYGLESEAGARLTTVHGGTSVLLRCAHPEITLGTILRPA
ncbi:MAG: peptidase [Desulfomicrobiaceae bacterium]|jgi:putative protease|nr:peptidase [Desulfomicrobiaceae bacterium]